MDTSVVVAGIAGFRTGTIAESNPSARLLREGVEFGSFTWVSSEEVLAEYKAVLRRLGVRRETIGILVNLLREEAEIVAPSGGQQISPDPGDDPVCRCAEEGRAELLVTLNPRDFPQRALRARVVGPGDLVRQAGRKR